MAWLRIRDMEEHLPFNIYDANGEVIRRAVTGFDLETGKVESFILDSQGKFVLDNERIPQRRLETYPAPLTWKKISVTEANSEKLLYLDLQKR